MSNLNIQIPNNILAMAAGQLSAQNSPLSAGFNVKKTPFALVNTLIDEQLSFTPTSPVITPDFGDFFTVSRGFSIVSPTSLSSISTIGNAHKTVWADLEVIDPSNVLDAGIEDFALLSPISLPDDNEQPAVNTDQRRSIGGKTLLPGYRAYSSSISSDHDNLNEDNLAQVGRSFSGKQLWMLPTPDSSVIDSGESDDDCEAEEEYTCVDEAEADDNDYESESEAESISTAHIPRGGKHPKDNHGQYDEIFARKAVREYARYQDDEGYEHPV